MSRVDWINTGLVLLLIGGSVVAWPDLPDAVPGHFGASGEITRWDPPTLTSWFGPPVMGIALAALLYWVARLLPGRPHLFNFPDKERFLALPPAWRTPVIAEMRTMLHGLTTVMLVLFAVIQWTRFRTAHGADPEPYILLVLLMTLLMTPLGLAVWVPRIQRAVDRQASAYDRARAAESSRNGQGRPPG